MVFGIHQIVLHTSFHEYGQRPSNMGVNIRGSQGMFNQRPNALRVKLLLGNQELHIFEVRWHRLALCMNMCGHLDNE